MHSSIMIATTFRQPLSED